jgi:hypothetical protein
MPRNPKKMGVRFVGANNADCYLPGLIVIWDTQVNFLIINAFTAV